MGVTEMAIPRRSRRRSRLLVSVMTCLAVTAALFAASTVGPTTKAFAAPLITICLTESSSYCVDVKSNDNTSGEEVWIWSHGGDDHWYEIPLGCPSQYECIPACSVSDCLIFQDAENTSLCLAASQTEGADLISCQLAEGGTARAAWVQVGTHLVNVFWGPNQLMVEGPLYNGDPLLVQPYGAQGGWYQWTGP
jgi:hypothetical protein